MKLTREKLAECLNRLEEASDEQVIKDKEFMDFHLNRNYFNNKYASDEKKYPLLKELWQIDSKIFEDNLNRKWVEETVGIVYHRPSKNFSDKWGYVKDFSKKRSERFCRKFVSRDEHVAAEGYGGGCEFELIIRVGWRMVGGPFMETYNFGGSATLGLMNSIGSTMFGLHGKFDVSPHKMNDNYVTTHYKTAQVRIHDWIN